jgi:hypothetical protein
MSIVMAPGRIMVPGSAVSPPSGFSWTTQGSYFVFQDAPITLTIATSSPVNPRIDIAVISVQDSQFSGASNLALAQIVTGTAAASPVAPAAPVNSVIVAQIAVAANATSIVNANITSVAVLATVLGVATAVAAVASVGSKLVVPTTVAQSGGSASISTLGAVTFTGVTSVSLNGCFTGTFDNYKVIYQISTSSAAANLFFKVRASGTDLASGYFHAIMQLASASPSYVYSTTATAVIVGDTNGSGQGGDGTVDVFTPFLASYTGLIFDNTCQTVYTRGVGNVPNTTSYDGFTLAPNTGTITGVARVIGWNNG